MDRTPSTPPTLAVYPTSTNQWTHSAAWNGATGISRWLVLAGPDQLDMAPVASEPWNGLITSIDLTGTNIRFVRVIALGDANLPLGISDPVPVGP